MLRVQQLKNPLSLLTNFNYNHDLLCLTIAYYKLLYECHVYVSVQRDGKADQVMTTLNYYTNPPVQLDVNN